MNRERDHIENQQHLSESQLIQYSDGVMTDAEMYQVELHLLSCTFCSEALEGIELLNIGDKKSAMNALHLRFQSRIRSNKPAPKVAYWKWAAVAAILLLSSVALFVLLDRGVIVRNEIVTKQSEQHENLRTVEPQPLSALNKDSSIRHDELITDNGFVISEKYEDTNSSKREPPMSAALNPAFSEAAEMERDISAVSAAEKEAFESITFMEEATDLDSKIYVDLPDSISVGETLAGRTMGLEYSRVARANINKQVRGKVLDEEGDPLPGAVVKLSAGGFGVTSDIEGNYNIPLPDSTASLSISFIGYVPKEIEVGEADSFLTTTLTPDVTALSEVVVIGYGTQEKRSVSGSVVSVKPKVLPEPSIGNRRFNKYIRENLTTEKALQSGVKGTLTLSFFVNTNGSLTDFTIVAPIGFGLDEKAIQLIKEGPEWTPARDNEGLVREKVILTIPVEIKKNKR